MEEPKTEGVFHVSDIRACGDYIVVGCWLLGWFWQDIGTKLEKGNHRQEAL